MIRRLIYIAIFIFLVVGISSIAYVSQLKKNTLSSPTYFSYQQSEIEEIASLSSEKTITEKEIGKWDEVLFNLVKDHKLGDAYAAQIYAYLYTAQRDAAFLSYNAVNSYMGSLDQVSSQVLCLFFADSCINIKKQVNEDPYSEKIANIVVGKINARINENKLTTKLAPELSGNQYWKGSLPFFAQEVGSWRPWFLSSGSEFRAPPPPIAGGSEWQLQLSMTKTALENVTPEQKKLVVYWAGNPGTITPPGQWLMLANEYMVSKKVSLENFLLVRSVLAMGILDSVIAVFDSKYSYWIKRPNMLDTTIITVMPTPNHPSYPAGHSVISGAAATILSYYFPENKSAWIEYQNEASSSRILGGIHFTIDAEQGLILGKKVGEKVVAAQKGNHHE